MEDGGPLAGEVSVVGKVVEVEVVEEGGEVEEMRDLKVSCITHLVVKKWVLVFMGTYGGDFIKVGGMV